MCKYIKENYCEIANDICPFVYFCDKDKVYKPVKSNGMIQCKLAVTAEVPKGYCLVEFEQSGELYIRINKDEIKVIKNPFDETPLYVKLTKKKNGKISLQKWSEK